MSRVLALAIVVLLALVASPSALAQPAAPTSTLEEALAARNVAPSADTIRAPMPSDGDEGRYLRVAEEGENEVAFAWQQETFSDEWGREVEGFRVSVGGLPGGSCTTAVTGAPGGDIEQSTETLGKFFRYIAGAARPVAYGGDLDWCISGGAIDPSQGVAAGAIGQMRVEYDSWITASCLFRNEFQALDLASGAKLARTCGEFDGAPTWDAGEIAERDGFRTLDLFHVNASEGAQRVTRVRLADGLSHPLLLEVVDFEAGAPVANLTYRLVAFRAAGTPIPLALAPADPVLTLAPVDPLLGPEDADARLPIRLSDAARAATTDPTLTQLQSVLAKGEAALAGAIMSTPPQPSGAPTVQPTWMLLFAAPDGSFATVECQGAAPPVALAGAPPVVRCREASADGTIGDPPEGFGIASLPAGAIGFREALARLEAHDPNATGRAITHALYRPWSAPFLPASLEIGTVAFDVRAPVSVSPQDEGSISVLDLATGRSIVDVAPIAQPVVVEALPDGIDVAGVSGSAPAPVSDAPILAPAQTGAVVAAAAAIGALVVLAFLFKGAIAGFFTRLVRPRVLDAQMRSEIHALVQTEPGIHASEMIQRFGRGTGLVEYHLGVLVREGFLVSMRAGGFRHYFPAGRFSPQQMRAIAALRVGQAEKLYRLIAGEPGIGITTLVERSGLSQGYVSKEVKRLSEAGLVSAVRAGRSVELRALPAVAEEN